jgi:hypothetical protein
MAGSSGWADIMAEGEPPEIDVTVAHPEFLASAVGFLAGEADIRQFLDVGTGLPTENSTHEAAQSAAPDSRVVYVDTTRS